VMSHQLSIIIFLIMPFVVKVVRKYELSASQVSDLTPSHHHHLTGQSFLPLITCLSLRNTRCCPRL
jgi:hypothetical protein